MRRKTLLIRVFWQACFGLLLLSCGLIPTPKSFKPTLTATALSYPKTVFEAPDTPISVEVIDTATNSPGATGSPSPTASSTKSLTPTVTILPLSCLPSGEDEQYALVKKVQDGETIIVDIAGGVYVVRYLGIQAPAYSPVIAEFGPSARNLNASLVTDQVVKLMPDGADKNSAGQLQRYVIVVGSDQFVNFELVRRGFARLSANSSSLACGGILAQAEALARKDQVGMWAPTATPRPTRTLAPTRTGKPSATLKPTANLTLTAISLLTSSPTATSSTDTPTATSTITSTATLTETLTATPTGSLTPSPSASTSPTVTETQSATPYP